MHGGPGRGREDVAGVDGAAVLVLVDLGDDDVRDDAGDVDAGSRLLERQPVDRGVAVLHEEVRGERRIRGRDVRGISEKNLPMALKTSSSRPGSAA